MKSYGWLVLFLCLPMVAQEKRVPEDKFRQLEEVLPTPNDYRTASGAPGHAYWQQRADYDLEVRLDDNRQWIYGKGQITYTNNSPDTLRYLWVQLDQNRFQKGSDGQLIAPMPKVEEEDTPAHLPDHEKMSFGAIDKLITAREFDGGYRITAVRDTSGKTLSYVIAKTMMRLDLEKPLQSGKSIVFEIEWNYPIVSQKHMGGRAGYEYFEKDDNYLYEIAQWFPRMAAYTDVNGWQNKQFLGRGEFTLEFGDYEVAITVPADHVVASTGVLQNPNEVLSARQKERLKKAEKSDRPVIIVTESEAIAAEKTRAKATKTWRFAAKDVRDFAFASSRKFIWDAQGYTQSDGSTVMAMSYYPKEGNPLWERYSTHAVVHTLEHYNKYTLIYPYPVAISVNGPVFGMEYPMICFNGPRPEEDKTYGHRTKYGLISVIIHEVGHNYFPMIVNSDERQWTWMDEGLNTFVQFLAEQAWEEKYPSRRGDPTNIIEYMVSEEQVPIMTNSESLLQFGNNAYGKPATALNILRESIMGRELFDFAFREYSRRWGFKRPMPADFFRTMEDASGVDLDWFWRGWFYSTDHVDIAITGMKEYQADSYDPDVELTQIREERRRDSISDIRNRDLDLRTDAYPELKDFYNENDKYTVTPKDRQKYQEFLKGLKPHERELLKTDLKFYAVDFENIGGLVMPLLLEVEYAGGDKEMMRIPAEIWRYNPEKVTKMIISDREIKAVTLDPYRETADADLSNNSFPPRVVPSRFRMFKKKRRNMMQEMKEGGPASVGTQPTRKSKP